MPLGLEVNGWPFTMSKVLKDGREYFDGDAVDIYEGRFTGPFEMDEEDGAPISNGDLVTFLVTARVDTPKFSYVRKSGDLKRSNTMKVVAVIPIELDKARAMLDQLGESVEGVNDGIIEGEVTIVKPEEPSDDFLSVIGMVKENPDAIG